MRTLLQIFQDTKEILCRYDYYIHTQKRVLHLTNSEIKIPHLMGMQYLGKPGIMVLMQLKSSGLRWTQWKNWCGNVSDFLALWEERRNGI